MNNSGSLNYKKNRTSILCPTRNRPDALVRMMSSALEQAACPENVEFCFYIDEDDTSYKIETLERLTKNITLIRGPKVSLSSMYNILASRSTGEFLLWTGDDTRFLSINWEKKLQLPIEIVPDKLVVSYANDLGNYRQIYATNGMVHRRWIQIFGFLFTPHMRDNGVDFWISYVARNANRLVYCEDVTIEHLQYRQNKAPDDETYSSRRIEHQSYNLPELYHACRGERQRDAVILQIAISQMPKPKLGFSFGTLVSRILCWKNSDFKNTGKFIYFCSIPDSYFILKVVRKFLFLPPLKMH